MKSIICVLLFLLTGFSAHAQSPAIQWEVSLGGSGEEIGYYIQQTTDGGYVVAGFSSSHDGEVTGNHGSEDYWVVKLTASGSIQWQKSLGGSGVDAANCIQQTIDGGYIIAGYSNSTDDEVTGNHGGAYDYWVVKIDDTGALQWQKCLGGSGDDEAYSVRQTADGGYIVAGVSNSTDGDVTGNHGSDDYWVVKLNDTGGIQWEKSYGGSNGDACMAIQQTMDGGYIMTGNSVSFDGEVTGGHGSYDYWVVKINDTGAIQWEECLGGSGDDEGQSIQQTTDGGYIVAGFSASNDGNVSGNHGGEYDYWVVKINDTGAIEWQECLGGSDADQANSIRQTLDGGYIVAGQSSSDDDNVSGNHGIANYWVVKLNGSGAIQWQKCLGGSLDDGAACIQQTADSGYIVTGFSSSNDGEVTGNHGQDDMWVVKLSDTLQTEVPVVSKTIPITLMPNPTTGDIYVSVPGVNIRVYNTLGQCVKEVDNTNTISVSGYPNGMYYVVVYDQNERLLLHDMVVKE